MVEFGVSYPIDYVFIKFLESRHPVNIPLCELLSGVLVRDKLTSDTVVLYSEGLKEDNEDPLVVITREGFRKHIESILELGPIESYALQPEGENTVPEVNQFLEKFKNCGR